MTFKFSRFEIQNDEMQLMKYEFQTEEETMDWVFRQIEEFKIINNIETEEDPAFIRYKTELLNTSTLQLTEKLADFEWCKKCSEEDHERECIRFCRCERRNIRIARFNRLKMGDPKCYMWL